MTVDSSDRIIVADTANGRVQVFNSAGAFLFTFGSFGTGEGQFNFIKGVAVDSADRILVSIPQFHSYGIDIAMAAAISAGCEIEVHRNYSPAAVRSALGEGKITVWPAVPLMFHRLEHPFCPPNKESFYL